jgi:hypothetical protein
VQQARNDAVVELLLEDGREVRRHLAEGVAAGKADAGVLQTRIQIDVITTFLGDRKTMAFSSGTSDMINFYTNCNVLKKPLIGETIFPVGG